MWIYIAQNLTTVYYRDTKGRHAQLEHFLREDSDGIFFPLPSAGQVIKSPSLLFPARGGAQKSSPLFPLGGARPASLGLMGRLLAGSGEPSLHLG